jgi:anti-sigma regulatory factor (Ser/Thr protein kinase)
VGFTAEPDGRNLLHFGDDRAASMMPPMLHEAMFYSSDEEYVAGIQGFISDGPGTGGSVLIAVPEPKLDLLEKRLSHLGIGVHFVDMREVGINPARIIPLIEAFIDERPSRSLRVVCEPIWADRTEAETVECLRHEGLINEAFAGTAVDILCPYDTRDLDPSVLAGARRTHPTLRSEAFRRSSDDYVDPLETYAAADHPLPEPSAMPVHVSVGDGLDTFRSTVKQRAQSAGMGSERLTRLLIAANEAAANTLVHAGGKGSARIWHDEHELVCEVSDIGVIHDPLVGRRVPPPDRPGGRGVWLMNQLSDLVELRSGSPGTVVRIHMRRLDGDGRG